MREQSQGGRWGGGGTCLIWGVEVREGGRRLVMVSLLQMPVGRRPRRTNKLDKRFKHSFPCADKTEHGRWKKGMTLGQGRFRAQL